MPAFAPAPALRRAGARAVDLALTLGTSAFLAGVPLAQRVVTHLQDKLADARLSGLPQRVWLVDPTVLGCVGALLAVVLGLGLVYEAVPTALRGRTLGKALFGLRVVDARTRSRPALGRAVARLLSTTLLLGLGRDRLARTRVVRAPRRNAARQPGR
ncbi:RDD family protein [Streptacidiphilus monticola]